MALCTSSISDVEAIPAIDEEFCLGSALKASSKSPQPDSTATRTAREMHRAMMAPPGNGSFRPFSTPGAA